VYYLTLPLFADFCSDVHTYVTTHQL